MNKIIAIFAVFAFCGVATADYTVDYGWEGTATLLGMYPADCYIDDIATSPAAPVHTGSQSLYLERISSSTPQGFVAWIVNIADGDAVTVSFWCYDTVSSGYPSSRIWGHWNDDPNDPTGYNGSASGSSTFSSGIGWEQLQHTWTVSGGHTGLVVEARVYGDSASVQYFDDISVTVPDAAEVRFPGYVTLQRNTWADIKASF